MGALDIKFVSLTKGLGTKQDLITICPEPGQIRCLWAEGPRRGAEDDVGLQRGEWWPKRWPFARSESGCGLGGAQKNVNPLWFRRGGSQGVAIGGSETALPQFARPCQCLPCAQEESRS